MRYIIVLCLLLAAVVFFPPEAQAQQNVPYFEESECPAALRLPLGYEVECGYLTVLEDRSEPDGRTIRLFTTIFKAHNPDPEPDPLIYLEGGPGAGASRLAPYFSYLFDPFVADRDVILFDQRGTGFSEPSLQCEPYGLANMQASTNGMALEDAVEYASDALLECYQDYVGQGIDVNDYNSATSAADLNDLRAALGYEQWNLYGISYGTRLALTTIRDYPDGVRSIVIDSVVPVQGDLYLETPANGAGAFDRLFELCAADAACNEAYPNLESVFYETLDELNQNPVDLAVQRPLDGQTYTAKVNGDVMVGALFFSLYSTYEIPALPYIIYSAHSGDYFPLQQLLERFFTWDDIATVMHYAVNCNEEIVFNTGAEVAAATTGLDPRLQFFFDFDGLVTVEICEEWQTGTPNLIEREPVVSAVPSLVLSGELDPITPPRWGELAASTLENSFYVMIPGAGHGVTFSNACALEMMYSFINDPTTAPDAACLAGLTGPQFTIRSVN